MELSKQSKTKQNEQRWGFFGILLGTLDASKQGNMLTIEEVIGAEKEVMGAGEGDESKTEVLRAAERFKKSDINIDHMR